MHDVDVVHLYRITTHSNLKEHSNGTGTKQANHSITYTWTNMNVYTKNGKSQNVYDTLTSCCSGSLKNKTENKQLLNNVSGSAKPGELLALMGSSGAGKTTLLNSLTFRSDRNVMESGVRSINGVPVNSKLLTAVSAYVQQHDLFIGTLTVREHLIFQAMVRMDRHIPYEKRMARVEDVIQELSLTKCQNTIIGVTGRIKGLSGGEMKRLSFASEVLTDPPLMFCDEPTSGLDSYMAQNVVSVLKSMASKGKTIICTIHQPSSEVYSMFDKILLLASGRTAFLGSTNDAIEFFKTLGVSCPKNHNPADFFIQLLAIVPSQEICSYETIDTVCEAYESSNYKSDMIEHQKQLFSASKSSVDCWGSNGLGLENVSSPYKATWTEQFSAVFWRSWLSIKKEPALTKIRLIQTMLVAALISFIFYNQHLDQDGVMNINGALFMCISNMTFQNVLAVINVSILFRTTGVYARTPQRHVPDGRVLPEQNPGRGTDILGHTHTVHVNHVLHCGSKSKVHTLPHGYPFHNARQSGGRLVRLLSIVRQWFYIDSTFCGAYDRHTFPAVWWLLLERRIDSVLFPVAEPLLVVQVCQRRAASQPVGRHRLHPVQQSEHDMSPFRSRRLGVEQFSRGKQTTTLLNISNITMDIISLFLLVIAFRFMAFLSLLARTRK
ncbi:hypothetical protein AGLY_011107 [Aphis glycines]|uniref:Protein white n=1 Tax=Aphis glycines TaxID=307491 RepID=A0A6G0TDF0_APHGL|nr:hypothetical protein AGLY_011107 [Aphis glycines]